jgi:cell surface protein SprA
LTLTTRQNKIALALGQLFAAWLSLAAFPEEVLAQRQDTTKVRTDSTQALPYRPSRRPSFRLRDRYGDPFSNYTSESPLFLKDPTQLNLEVELDSNLNYTIYEKVGNLNYRPVTTMSNEEFQQFQNRQILKSYWQGKARSTDGESAVSGRSLIPKIFISPVLDRIFGGSYVELIPRGFVTLDFGGTFQKINNPSIPIRQQRNGGFEFDQQINMSVTGKIGEKLTVNANFDNNNSFDFQNNMKVEYTGFKEDILQKLEIGNVSLPLNNTLIQGSQNLFGVKAQMQFGKMTVTSIASTQRGKVSSIRIPGGSSGQGRPFEIIGSNYDDNRHFFLGHFFRENYEAWIRNLPQVISGVNVTRVEVYLLNRQNDTQTLRNVVGLMDLGEGRRVYNAAVGSRVPGPNTNSANDLSNLLNLVGSQRNADDINAVLEGLSLENGTDFEKITGARKLTPTEYTFHKQLGYITLSRKLQNDEALVVAYEYTYNGQNYKVGELSEDYANIADKEVFFGKLLRPRKVAIRDQFRVIIPTWDLMMKNIYTLNVNQLTRDAFQLRVIYRDDKTGIDNPQLQEGVEVRNKQLIQVFGLDKLNPVNDPQPDGNFDYVEGITVNSQSGLIIFPYLEPFNTALRTAFKNEPTQDALIEKYVYDTLYRTTKADAELFATKNKFYMKGTYNAGSSKEIMIPGFGVSPNSVRIFAGGTPLIEGQDFTVDYTFGRVTILNDAILNSGKDITVQYEQADPFAFQTRSLLGTRFDYKLSDEVNFGSTFLYYNERPLITRNLIGTEPARNVQYGFDVNVQKESRLLTKLIDAIPGIQTKEKSSFNWNAEFAQLLPGTSNIVDGSGTAYIDDFENTATPYSLMSTITWKLASVPRDFDPTGGATDDIRAGFRRAKLAWYTVDNQFYRDNGQFTPGNITEKDLRNHYMRPVGPQEIFKNKNRTQGNFFEQIFDLAYYPAERGPYNYNFDNINPLTGELANPKSNWAGITTAIRTEVDFDKANIEYVEFWLLDPFIAGENGKVIVKGNEGQNNTTGGKVVLQLGSISEDVMRDGKHAFENGLPTDGDIAQATQTDWGYVTNQQYVTDAFDNSAGSRNNQDVGLDGIDSEREINKFIPPALNPAIRALVESDPSADDFGYFLGGNLDDRNAKILERYKNFNNQENNTPIVQNSDQITRSGSPFPDNEDLNKDNTLSELEEYYEYDIDLKPGMLDVGSEYIVDKVVTSDNTASEQVTWYLYRIPVKQFERFVGNISGFKSIRYARLILTDFSEPVVLRMANFRMVGARWRRYQASLQDPGLVEDTDPDYENFSVSVVNIEENFQADPSGQKSAYRVPPGIIRDRDNTSSIPRQLNEQSVQVCIDNLLDGDSRAIYKNVEMDFFNYGRIKMFVHANSEANDDELVAFMRLGTDFDQNYYEVEIPIKISNPADADPRAIWPEENEFDFDLDDLYALKARRDREEYPLTRSFPEDGPNRVGRHGFRIYGRPDLSAVRVIMIGVRNPRSTDKRSHSICFWANELRLSDFDRTPGWAVNTSLNAKLADLGTINGSLRHTTYGFGSVSSKISERTRAVTTQYDFSANLNLDKLLPGNHGLKVPMFVSYENTTINPNYDPANPDMRLDAALKSFSTDKEREEYKRLIRDRTVRRSINFTNVRKVKVRQDARTHLWDVENLAFTYAYSEARQTSFTLKENLLQQYRAGVGYNFSPKGSGVEPFKNSKGLKSPYLKLIKDFNFSLLPSNISVRADLDRSFSKITYRNSLSNSEPNYQKYFIFNRTYNVQWNLTKSLTLDYAARANAVIDEPDGDINTREKRDSVMANLKRFGRLKNFDQSLTVNYKLPLDKIPFTDYLSADYRYRVDYSWKAGAINLPDTLNFGNTIANSRDRTLSGRIDMVKLYNKVKFLKDINTPSRPKTPAGRPQANQKPDTVKTSATAPAIKGLLRLLMSVRSINGTYSITESTTLPGFTPVSHLFGMDKGFEAPGWDFVLGSQNPDIRFKARDNDWLVKTPYLTLPFSQSRTRSISGRANLEPTNELKIQLDLKKDVTDTYQEIYRFDETDNSFQSLNPSRSGSYKITTLTISTAFNSSNGELRSTVFERFEKNLLTIRDRFNAINPTGIEYDTTTQDVLIPAFIAAYTGKSASQVSLSPFPRTPFPNWRVDYTGLTKLNVFKEAFQSITISHGYSSTYSVMNFSNSLKYGSAAEVGFKVPIEKYNNGIYGDPNDPIYVISQVLISEQFSPLIGVNLRTKGRFSLRADYKTKRDLSLNISNAQVTEMASKDVSVEVGYTKNNMKLPIKSQGRTVVLKNDVTFRFNLTVTDSKTIQRKIDNPDVVTNGNINIQIRPNISYTVNQKLTVQAYFDRTINDPQVSNAFRRATTRFGVQVRFSLAQ